MLFRQVQQSPFRNKAFFALGFSQNLQLLCRFGVKGVHRWMILKLYEHFRGPRVFPQIWGKHSMRFLRVSRSSRPGKCGGRFRSLRGFPPCMCTWTRTNQFKALGNKLAPRRFWHDWRTCTSFPSQRTWAIERRFCSQSQSLFQRCFLLLQFLQVRLPRGRI